MNLPIDTAVVSDITRRLTGLIPYGWGKKADPTWGWEQFLAHCKENGIDCSGFVGWILYQASGGKVHLTGGSYNQHDQLAEMAKAAGDADRGHYLTEAAKMDGCLRICGFAPHGDEAGHIWLVLNGVTSESHGPQGHAGGVRPRRFDYKTLAQKAEWVFQVTEPAAAKPAPTPPPFQTRPVKGFTAGGAMTGMDAAGCVVLSDNHAYVRATALGAILGEPLTASWVDGNVLQIKRG